MPKNKAYSAKSIVFDQTASKTLGSPQTDTSFIQADDSRVTTKQISQDEFDNIVSEIYMTETNLELLQTVKLLGEISNRRSSSGPMAGTQFVKDVTGITNSQEEVHRPRQGEVWQLIAASITTLDGAASMILNLIDAVGNLVQIDTFNATSNPMELNEPIYYTYDAYLSVRTSDASSGNARLAVSSIRVR